MAPWPASRSQRRPRDEHSGRGREPIAVLTPGVLLLASGHKSSTMVTIHKVSFILFGVLLALLPTIHAYRGAG
jgi:hypothetical protein